MHGFDVSERTIFRWKRRAPGDPERAKRLVAFLRNHHKAIAAMDFFRVPTVTFRLLYCLFIISHDRRKTMHFNAMRHPTSAWINQQLREAFPYESAPRFSILDRYSMCMRFRSRSNHLGSRPIQTTFNSPWQNGSAQRSVESCGRDLLD